MEKLSVPYIWTIWMFFPRFRRKYTLRFTWKWNSSGIFYQNGALFLDRDFLTIPFNPGIGDKLLLYSVNRTLKPFLNLFQTSYIVYCSVRRTFITLGPSRFLPFPPSCHHFRLWRRKGYIFSWKYSSSWQVSNMVVFLMFHCNRFGEVLPWLNMLTHYSTRYAGGEVGRFSWETDPAIPPPPPPSPPYPMQGIEF
jgi:hypothetical protein